MAGLVGPDGRLGLRAGRGRVGGDVAGRVGPGGVGWRAGWSRVGMGWRAGWGVGRLGRRVGWYGPVAVNVDIARKGVCNG